MGAEEGESFGMDVGVLVGTLDGVYTEAQDGQTDGP